MNCGTYRSFCFVRVGKEYFFGSESWFQKRMPEKTRRFPVGQVSCTTATNSWRNWVEDLKSSTHSFVSFYLVALSTLIIVFPIIAVVLAIILIFIVIVICIFIVFFITAIMARLKIFLR